MPRPKPVMLGEKITATIKAKYYFGSPVTKAKVKYKVNRTSYDERVVSDRRRGTGSTARATGGSPAITIGIPAGSSWGCPGRCRSGGRIARQPPELVADQEVEIGPDGTVKVEIDTGRGQGHPSRPGPQLLDHRRSGRRTRGERSSARARCSSPASRLRSTPGSIAATTTSATRSTPTSPPARSTASRSRARGRCTLLKISYKDGKPVETPVQTWPLNTNAEGTSQQQMTASQAGQYRISYKLADKSSSPLPLGEGPGVRATVSGQSAVGNPPPSSNPQSPIPNPSAAGPHPNPLPKGEGTGAIPSKAATSSPSSAKVLTARNSASTTSN